MSVDILEKLFNYLSIYEGISGRVLELLVVFATGMKFTQTMEGHSQK
jgi:hypothetical protein